MIGLSLDWDVVHRRRTRTKVELLLCSRCPLGRASSSPRTQYVLYVLYIAATSAPHSLYSRYVLGSASHKVCLPVNRPFSHSYQGTYLPAVTPRGIVHYCRRHHSHVSMTCVSRACDIHDAANHLSYRTGSGYAYPGRIICMSLAFCRKESSNPAYDRRFSATAFDPTGRFYLLAHRPPSLIPSVPSMFALQSSSKHHLTRHRNACSPACASGSAPFYCCYAYPYEVRRCAHLCCTATGKCILSSCYYSSTTSQRASTRTCV